MQFHEQFGELEDNETDSERSQYKIDVLNQDLEEFCQMVNKYHNLDTNDIDNYFRQLTDNISCNN